MEEIIQYRNTGAVGALLDEYERAINELITVVDGITSTQFTSIADPNTQDDDCRSIKTILAHVIKSGLWYAIEIRNSLGEGLPSPSSTDHISVQEYQDGLTQMFHFTEQVFRDYKNVDLNANRVFRWPQIRSIEILLEHAIVHILRHRRQIERFKVQLTN